MRLKAWGWGMGVIVMLPFGLQARGQGLDVPPHDFVLEDRKDLELI